MPRIADIKATVLEVVVGQDRAFGNARSRFDRRASVLIEVIADDGTTGWGEAWGAAPKATLGYLEAVKPKFIGKDVFDRNTGWHELTRGGYALRVQNLLTGAISGINIALYDLAGKLLGVPVYKLLGGGECDTVPCYASGGYFCNDPNNQLEHQLASVVGKG